MIFSVLLIALVIHTAFSCSLLYFSSASNLHKLGLVAMSFAIMIVVWSEFDSITGWPTHERAVPHSAVLYSAAREPTADDPGAIFYLVAKDGEVRLHKYPYSEQAASESARISKEIADGNQVVTDGDKLKESLSYDSTTVGDFLIINPRDVLVK
jgi:hypothetical protein